MSPATDPAMARASPRQQRDVAAKSVRTWPTLRADEMAIGIQNGDFGVRSPHIDASKYFPTIGLMTVYIAI
jgi:hypothetical protein